MAAKSAKTKRPPARAKAGTTTRGATAVKAARAAKGSAPQSRTAPAQPAAAAGPMLRVALTGGIATGKSYVLAQFRRRGVPCLDADQLTRGVIAPGTEATTAIAERFGGDVLAADGSVDRLKLASIVFSDAAARRDLEAIVHPAVYRAIHAGLRAFERVGNYPVGIVDVPLLYETGHAGEFDKVIVTACPVGLQLARLAERGMREEQARQRLAA
ncbi:MAG: dephospho-CoA kinase, partial [Acidobacteria bacterium]|nr:dephospho-CoA kinase [Acidobacteriota bacterium]